MCVFFKNTPKTHFLLCLSPKFVRNRCGGHCEVALHFVGTKTGSAVSPTMLPTLCCQYVVQTLCLGHCVGGILWEHGCLGWRRD